MQPVNVLFLVAAIIVTLLSQGGLTYEIVGDLSALQDQYQSLLTNLGSEDTLSYDTSIATLLGKLDALQYSSSHLNSTLEWFTPPLDISTHPPLRITIVVSSFEGMFLNSGIGTFYSSLTDFLLQRGHAVTILYADTAASDTPAFTRWSSQVARRGAKAVRLGAFAVHLRLSTLAQRSYQVYEYLKNHQPEFDLVHFPEWEGLGYYSLVAKKDGIAFDTKVLVVGVHGPWRWVKAANYHHSMYSSKLQSAEDMETDWMERKSVEMSDMVWTPSADIITWLKAQGWGIPQSTYLMPYLPGREVSQLRTMVRGHNDDEEEVAENINELVFFGRLETRKGLELFADALDRLSVTRPEFAGTKITFLGRPATIGNQTATAYIDERLIKGAWPFKVVYISHKDRKAALEYLLEPTRVAVIPSLVDNTPYTVYECLFANIPFIASNIPSISAIVASDDRSEALFETDFISLANKLEQVLDNGVHIAKSTLLLSQIEHSWNGFYSTAHQIVLQQRDKQKERENKPTPTPLVSVCVIHYNRPYFLQQALKSIEMQTYKNFEVVLVDDGSTTQEAKDYLTQLEPQFASKGWKLIRSKNQYLGAARNLAVESSRADSDFVFFLDDDNLARPNLLHDYIAVATHTKSDIVTAAHDVVQDNSGEEDGIEGEEGLRVVGRWVPLGGSPVVGIFKNCFGDANFFIKRTAFKALNGFTEDRDVGQEDHEFLAKAILSHFSLSVIPEPLLAYRMHNQSEQMLYTTDSLKNALRAHRPYRSLIEESGMEVSEKGFVVSKPTQSPDSLKLLAYSRSHSRRDESCNLTISGVSPAQFPARQSTTLTFTTLIRDCDIGAIRIGDAYNCINIQANSDRFSCRTNIAVPGNYPVYFRYTTDNAFRETGTRVSVTQSPNSNGATTALATMAVYIEAGLFDENELFGLMAAQTNGAPASSYSLLSDTVTPANALKRATANEIEDELHTMLISITNLSPSAFQVFNLLYAAILANSSCLLPYRFHSLDLNAICSVQGVCSCTPNYVGTGCTTPARCPSDCSNNGACINGNNGKLCKCNEGWGGNDCSIGMCPNSCSNNGDCIMQLQGGNASCSCHLGWLGDACDVPNCPGNCNGYPCSSGVCQCPDSMSTPDCSTLGDENTGNIRNTAAESKDNRDRDLFIGILVLFVALVAIAGAAVYYHRQRRQRQLNADE